VHFKNYVKSTCNRELLKPEKLAKLTVVWLVTWLNSKKVVYSRCVQICLVNFTALFTSFVNLHYLSLWYMSAAFLPLEN